MLDPETTKPNNDDHEESNTSKLVEQDAEQPPPISNGTEDEKDAEAEANNDKNGKNESNMAAKEEEKEDNSSSKKDATTITDNGEADGGEAKMKGDDNKDKINGEDDMASSNSSSKDGEGDAMDVEEAVAPETKEGEEKKDVEMKDAAEPVKKEEEEKPEESKPPEGSHNKADDKAAVKQEKVADAPQEAEAKVKKEEEKKKADGGDKSTSNAENTKTAETAAAADPSPPPPVLKGTLSYSLELRRHLIRGMWNYENSKTFPPQRFELYRRVNSDEDPTELPKDGEFHGSFSLAYYHTTSKGKQKERSKVIPESGVNIKFTKVEGTEKEYKVDGKGTNQFGIFHINGTATPSTHEGDLSFNIVLRKRYEPSQPAAAPAPVAAANAGASKKRKSVTDNGSAQEADGPLPPPSKSFDTGVVCLRGKLYKEESSDLGATDVVHRINGMWANGLNLILADPQNVQGHCNRFEYEHKSTVPNNMFPVSGRYSGWFDLTNADGSKTKVNERDVMLRFQKNSAGYHNVEGRGTNAFGKYSITGTLSLDNVITIFRQFKPIKTKTKVTSAPPPINKGSQARRPSTQQAFPEPRLKMEDVVVPEEGKKPEDVDPIAPPDHSAYSAVSRGVLKLSEDGSHMCTGKWAVTREHFTSGQTSAFSFRLEAHYALEAANELKNKDKKEDKKEGEDGTATTTTVGTPVIPEEFPLDSALYKGTFQLKKGGSRYQTIVDQQIVMKFRKNKQGSYNVYGRGQNVIGVFNLIGTLIMRGKTSGQVELYRVYPPDLMAAPSQRVQGVADNIPGKVPSFKTTTSGEVAPLPDSSAPKSQPVPSASTILPVPPRAGMVRRESTRLVKLPSRLEDDDPTAQLSRVMEKCSIILRQIREKDLELGAFFSEPVDPDALGIPTYRQVISEPMDLGTIAKKMDSNQIDSPEEFARLARLVFENAMTFNVDPTHSVHLAARSLLVSFNQKYRDMERVVENLRRTHKGADVDGKKKKKDDKKRKRTEEPQSLKRRRLEEAQAMSQANANAMATLVAAAPKGVPNAAVSRGEFSMMIHMIELLQKQIVQTHTALAELSPGDEIDTVATLPTTTSAIDSFAAPEAVSAPAPAPAQKKAKKKAAEPAPKKQPVAVEEPEIVFDETKPLTLQEQETLTETINNMPPDHIPGVIQIIRESASLAGDEDEIDLEIDQLDTVTQRRLLRHVSKVRKVEQLLFCSLNEMFQRILLTHLPRFAFWH